MPTATVDGIEVEFELGATVLQVCELAGKEIPRFCYHERLSVAGNCRMCLVQIEGGPPKPAASCAMPCAPDMKIHTDTPMVKKAREGVLEFLLINHPLDCPICDQGGECDLQDQAMAYGVDHTRFEENKRAVDDKNMGPLIKTIMTRCIHCTRCVRFSTEIAGVTDMGLAGRGENAEITTYLEKALDSELSGNVIDLCPVGALTSRPYAFTARPWELRKTESIDVMDAVGSNIRIDARGREVMRVLPRLHEDINEEWISDKTRYIWDGLKRQRLDKPYVKKDGKLQPVSWDEAFDAIAARLKGVDGKKIAAIAGDLADTEAMYALKGLMANLGSANLDCRQNGSSLGGERSSYLFNTTIAGIEEADAILLIGTNPRTEAPLINARIRKRWLEGGLKVANIGPVADLTYDVAQLGAGPETLSTVASGASDFAKVLKGAERPMLIIGQGALARADGAAILAEAAKVAETTGMVKDGWNGFNVLHTAAATVAGLDLGFVPGQVGKGTRDILTGAMGGEIEVVYLLGADEIDTGALDKAFVIYQGSHGDAGAHAADVILPGAAYTEKNALWVSTEGRVQAGRRAVFAPGDAKEDWAILRALSAQLGKTLPYDSLGELRTKLFADHPHMAELDTVQTGASLDLSKVGKAGEMDGSAFRLAISDFYLTNPIARASAIMAECSALFDGRRQEEAAG
ncbi:MAG: NADH-quinone oxidoreductase subunit G [Alphaproteobacteria bacterium]|nr:MAG: NADH-quinone oxidoreductase subunit G [Alphaproteobacteria bacterium]